MSVKDMLEAEIKAVLESIEDMDPKTDEYKKAADELTKLMDRLNEMEKIELESERATNEHYIKLAQFRCDKKYRMIDTVVKVIGIAVPAILTVWGTAVTLKYDEKGIFPSTNIGRGFINNLLPKK